MNGGTNWTRVYTQVWSNYDQTWIFGSCVGYVTAGSYMSGQYYCASRNRYVPVPTNDRSTTRYSSEYFDYSWRKDNAALGFIYSWIQYNIVGDVQYRYGGSTKITHRENF